MRYVFFNECLTATKEVSVGFKLDTDPLNIREFVADFTTIFQELHSAMHDVQQRVINSSSEARAKDHQYF